LNKKNKSYLLIAMILLSIYLVVPTFVKDNLPSWWKAKPMRLGLDLKGGSYLVLGVKTNEAIKSQLNTVAGAIKSELKKERLGLIKSKSVAGNSIEVTLLGDKGLDRVRSFVQKEYSDFKEKEVKTQGTKSVIKFGTTDKKLNDIEQNAVIQAIETIRNRVDQYGVSEPVIQRAGKKRIMVQLPDVTNLDTVKKTIGSVAKLEFRAVTTQGGVRMKNREGIPIFLEEDVLMSGDAIEKALVEIDPQTNETQVTLKFNPIGKKTFARITTDYNGKQLAIILDGVVQSNPVIREPILGGTAQISGGFTKEEAHRLAVVLRSGALPAPLTFEEERTVGASLGADSIKKGITAMLYGALAVMIFMLIYYKKSGVIAVTSLLLNMLFLLAFLSLFGATLTLPGLAGLALTIGMAVDANIIIFDRIREEMDNGSTGLAAIKAGFDKAHITILDSNITTLLTGLVLYSWGTGPIKGFAVTLCVGILTTMFTALFVSRFGFTIFNVVNKKGELSI